MLPHKLSCRVSPPTFRGKYVPHPSVPSHTPAQALHRFAQFSSALYTQAISWNTKTWRPRPTKFKKLVPFYSMSILLVSWTSFSFYTLTRWILFKKMGASDVSLTAGVLLVLYSSMNTISVTMILTNVWKTEEICLLYINSRLLSHKVGIQRGKKIYFNLDVSTFLGIKIVYM